MTQRLFRDKAGKVVLAQWPNWALIGWAGFALLSRFTQWKQLTWVATGFLLAWAMMEIFQGVNYFRRLLGLTVLLLTIGPLFR